MKTFQQWVELNQTGYMPTLGQQNMPVTQGTAYQQAPPGAPQNAPGQINLKPFIGKVQDPNWHILYGNFTKYSQNMPHDPKIQQLGQALYRSGQSGNMSALRPFLNQIQATPIR